MSRARSWFVPAILVATICAALWSSGWWRPLWDSLEMLARSVHDRYGIDVPFALALFGVGEVLFCLSAAMMLRETGRNVSWRAIHSLDFKHLNLGSRRMMGWLWLNRLSWIVPWLVVIAESIGKVPWWATVAAALEAGSTFLLGVVISFGLKLPWWNSSPKGDVE